MIQTLKNYFYHLPKSYFYALINGFPAHKLTLIGITGTDGKTTTCNLIYEIMQRANFRVGIISTLGVKIGDTLLPIPPHMTSPDPSLIQSIFRQMVRQKVTHVVVEVTAHALDQFRFAGCHFQIAGITNVSHEHLDYFHTMENYIHAKAELFKNADIAVFNKDDESYPPLKLAFSKNEISYSQHQSSDFTAKDITVSDKFLRFKVGETLFATDSNYAYQVNNILLAWVICLKLSINPKVFLETIYHFPFIRGRRENVVNDFNIKSLIDFAHTPAALKETLLSLRKSTPGRIIVIFGATGGRDQSKRPIMGQYVSQLADIAIVTADDTRHEKVEEINQQIISGFDPKFLKSKKFIFFNIPNRQDAFNLAVSMADSKDTIIACGKGHETTILHGTTEYPWSERSAFDTAFKLKSLDPNK